MINGKQLYRSSFIIRIDDSNTIIYCSLLAYNDEDAIKQLPIRILDRIGFITKNIKNIILTKDSVEIRRFTNLEELKQEAAKV